MSGTCEQDPTVEPLNCWPMAFRLRQWIAVTMTAGTECVQAVHVSEHQVPRGRERRGSYVTGWSTRDTTCTLSCQCASVKRKTVSVPGSKWAFFSLLKTKQSRPISCMSNFFYYCPDYFLGGFKVKSLKVKMYVPLYMGNKNKVC